MWSACVDAKRDIFDFPTLLVTEFDEGRKEGRGQVIDAKIADVLETFQRVRLAGSRKTGDHHELESWHSGPLRDQSRRRDRSLSA